MPSGKQQRFEFQQNSSFFFVQPRSKKRTRQFDDNVEEMEQDIVTDEGVWLNSNITIHVYNLNYKHREIVN